GTVDLAASQTEFDCDDLGVSTVIVTATGSNENTAQCEIAITLEDNQSPTIECQDVEYFLEEGSSLIINLSDAIVTLEDNCQLEIEEPLEIELGCTALGENLFELTAIDQGGNSSICTFNLTFTDSLDLCNQLSISGQLLTKDGLPIGLGEVFLFTNGLSSDFQTTSSDGQFEFQGLAFGSNQLIEPIKHINPMNGVTTWDIVLVQAHILGLRLLNSPYQLIAADVRPDGTLNVLDLIDMRNLILGRTNRFPFNQSWKLINSEQNLPTGLLQPTHPDDLETIREYLDLNESINDANFIGVKIGDVNNSNDPSNLRNSEDRADSKETVSLNTNLNDLQNKVKLDFFTDEKITPLGMQFAFKFDPNKLEFKDWKKGILPELQLENFNFQRLEDGIILLSWNSFMEYSNYKAAPLFSFYFRKKSINGGTPDFSFCDQHLSPEVVIDLDNSKPLSFTGNKQAIANPISQLEVRPNPFSSAVEILFLTESPSKVTLGIYDDLGQHLFTKTVSTLLGRNSIRLEEDKFQNSGIYHFRLQSENAVEYGRLIFIKSN
ncbi:MAG: T9SS C-terminal target domain-containing protein, partial [Saprospirales bacterium]